jgi:hypothetical protein
VVLSTESADAASRWPVENCPEVTTASRRQLSPGCNQTVPVSLASLNGITSGTAKTARRVWLTEAPGAHATKMRTLQRPDRRATSFR